MQWHKISILCSSCRWSKDIASDPSYNRQTDAQEIQESHLGCMYHHMDGTSGGIKTSNFLDIG